MARSMDGSNPFIARRLLGPSPLPLIGFPFHKINCLSKQYSALCCSLQCLCVVNFNFTSDGADISCTTKSSHTTSWQGKSCWYLKLCDPHFAALSKAFLCMASRWLDCCYTEIPLQVVLSPLLLLSSGLSPNLLYMWWRNKIS